VKIRTKLYPLALLPLCLSASPQARPTESHPATLNIDSNEVEHLNPATFDAYRAHLAELKSLIADCQADHIKCDTTKVGTDETIAPSASHPEFQVHYDWLRNIIIAANSNYAQPDGKKKSDADLAIAAARIDTAIQEARGTQPPEKSTPDLAHANSEARRILANPDYNYVETPSYWTRLQARFFQWLAKLFLSAGDFGRRSPWLPLTIEIFLTVLALTGLGFWALQIFRRQQVALARYTHASALVVRLPHQDWLALAQQLAEKNEWRDAVHCLYWATINVLEERRFWQPSRARTPREYLRLLEPGSERQQLLRQQTRSFERIWYGQRPAAHLDYSHALDLYERLRSA
jgi:hypothetical protein